MTMQRSLRDIVNIEAVNKANATAGKAHEARRLGNWEDIFRYSKEAMQQWERAGRNGEAARVAISILEFGEASRLLETAGWPDQDISYAGILALKNGDYERTSELLAERTQTTIGRKVSPQELELAHLAELRGNFKEAGELYREAGLHYWTYMLPFLGVSPWSCLPILLKAQPTRN